jgi:hypothetical protein
LWNQGICAAACCTIRSSGQASEGSHVFQVPGREAFHAGEFPSEVVGEPIDDLGTPAMLFLPSQDVPADLPVEEDELAVNRDRSLELRRPDSLLELAQELLVPLGPESRFLRRRFARLLLFPRRPDGRG